MTETVKPQLAAHDRCTGCGACASGCPKGAIHMVRDKEGFLYPQITDGCVSCGHCAHVCPVLKQREVRGQSAVFAVWNEDSAVCAHSTAGGVFTALADYALECGGVVFGAALDEKLQVRHMAVKNKEDLRLLRGAKPIQSELGETFQQVQLYLEQGRFVLFSGTPCQVDGLYRFLGEHPEKLLTCDFGCSGVGSPGVWARFVESMVYVKRRQAVDVRFCDKLKGEKDRRFRVWFEGGGTFDAPLGKCQPGRGILRRLFLRPACYHCPYCSTNRAADLTLGTFRGLPADFRPNQQKKGISMLLINTVKGAHFFDMIPLQREKRTLQEAVESNPALSRNPASPKERAAFFDAYVNQPFHKVYQRFFSISDWSYRVANDGKLRNFIRRIKSGRKDKA